MIAARRLTKRYGRITAVDSVDFTLPAGEVVGFLGPNGAGKTTTMRMLVGAVRPTQGQAEICGIDVWRDRHAVARRIGYLPESAPLYPEMRVAEYLGFRARLYGLPRREARDAVDRAIGRCWLEEVRRRTIQQLSKGFRQRVGLAGALLHDPDVLVLDEPTSGLDPQQIREVRRLIRELAGDRTVLLSTHILSEVEQTCDRVLMIARGRLRLQGPIDELRSTASRAARYVVETKMAGAADCLGKLPQVKAVDGRSAPGGWQRLTVTARPEAGDLREPIASALNGGGMIRELRREGASLEQLFIQVVGEAGDAGESAS